MCQCPSPGLARRGTLEDAVNRAAGSCPAFWTKGMEESNSRLHPNLLSSGSSSRLSPERPSPRLGYRNPQRCARQTNRGLGARSWAGSPPTPPTPPQLKPSPVTTEGFLGGRKGAAAPDTLGSLRVCNFARRTGARPRTPCRVDWTLPRATHQPPGAQRRGASAPASRGKRASHPTSYVLLTAPGRPPRHLLRPPPSFPSLQPPSLGKLHSPSPPRGVPVRGTCGGGRGGRSEGGGDVKRLSQPSPLATSTPTRQPSRGAWSGRWGEKARLFWVLRIASSSFSLRRQLRRRRALPGSASQRSGDPQPGAPARAMRAPAAAPAAALGGGSAGPGSLGSHSRCGPDSLRRGRRF